MTAAVAGLHLELPEGFVILAAADPALVEVATVPDELHSWYDEVTRARADADAVLLALQLEESARPEEPFVAVALAAHLLPLDEPDAEVVVQALRAIALTRTSSAGEVAVLDLPAGPAVAAADVVHRDGREAAQVTLQLPLQSRGQLLTLTLATPAVDQLPACAALTAAVAARVRVLDDDARPGPDRLEES